MYITFEEYVQMYDGFDERVFNRLLFDACRVMDIHTTGIDNVHKLRLFFPTDENAVVAVKRCAAELIHFLDQIRTAEVAAYQTDMNGVSGRVVASVTSGNESISYTSAPATAISEAAKNPVVRDQMMAETIWRYLSGVEDANGVNLLFMGRYPRRYVC